MEIVDAVKYHENCIVLHICGQLQEINNLERDLRTCLCCLLPGNPDHRFRTVTCRDGIVSQLFQGEGHRSGTACQLMDSLRTRMVDHEDLDRKSTRLNSSH